jgi:hypothetical protein
MFLSVDGGRSWIFSSGTSQGVCHRCFLALMVDAPGSLALASLRGAHRRCFLALMVDALGSPALAPPIAAIDIFYVDGGRSRISVSTTRGPPSTFLSIGGGRSRISSSGTSQGVHHRCFLVLMVDALRSLAPAQLGGPSLMFLSVDGGCFWITSFGTS